MSFTLWIYIGFCFLFFHFTCTGSSSSNSAWMVPTAVRHDPTEESAALISSPGNGSKFNDSAETKHLPFFAGDLCEGLGVAFGPGG